MATITREGLTSATVKEGSAQQMGKEDSLCCRAYCFGPRHKLLPEKLATSLKGPTTGLEAQLLSLWPAISGETYGLGMAVG